MSDQRRASGGEIRGGGDVHLTDEHVEWHSVSRRYRRNPGGWWWAAALLIPAILAALGLSMGGSGKTAASTTTATGTATASASASATSEASPTSSDTTTSSPATPVGGAMGVTADGTSITLMGVVPTEADKARLMDAVAAQAKGLSILDKLTVDAGAVAPDAAGWGSLVAAAAQVKNFNGAFDGSGFTLTGEAPSDAVKTAVGSAAAAIAKTGKVSNNLTVAAGAGDACATLGGDIAAMLGASKITFETGGSTVTAASTTVINQIAQMVSGCVDTSVTVTGYTDNTGNADKNKTLSQARADAVKALLVKAGLAVDRITSTGMGQENPIAANDTEAGRAANRRVEITVK